MAKSNYTTFASQTLSSKLDRDHKRATDARRKYDYGTTVGRGTNRTRPARPAPTNWVHGPSPEMKQRSQSLAQAGRDANHETRFGKHNDYLETDTTLLSPWDIQEDFMYSYDHASGPSTGSEVLGLAIDRAVERFENQVTETLVKHEYSVVDSDEAEDKESEHEDDFELV